MTGLTPVNLKQAELFAFAHPEKVADLMGVTVRQIRDGMDAGSVPFCTPFATGKEGERPTRFVDVDAWVKRVSGDS